MNNFPMMLGWLNGATKNVVANRPRTYFKSVRSLLALLPRSPDMIYFFYIFVLNYETTNRVFHFHFN